MKAFINLYLAVILLHSFPCQVIASYNESGQSSTKSAHDIERLLENIIIPEIHFTDVAIEDAIAYLAEQSKLHDPEGIGVTFSLHILASNYWQEEYGRIDRLSLHVKNTPLIQLLEYIMTLTNLQFKINPEGVMTTNYRNIKFHKLKSFQVDSSFFKSEKQDTAPLWQGQDVQPYLKGLGIHFGYGDYAVYFPESSRLVMRNSLGDHSMLTCLLYEKNSKEHSEATQLFERMTKVRIPKLALNKVPLDKAVEIFNQEIIKADLNNKSNVIQLTSENTYPTANPDVHLRLFNVSLIEVLHYLCDLTGSDFKLEDGIITILPPEKSKSKK